MTLLPDRPPLEPLRKQAKRLRRGLGAPADVRECARLLLEAGVDPNGHTTEGGGERSSWQ